MIHSFVAIGDSFTEGVGDAYADGEARGWADLLAYGLELDAASHGEHVAYANLAIRGRKLVPLLDEQLAPAIAQHPEMISINGGGNDLMRPRVEIADLSRRLREATLKITDAGIHALVLAGPDPTHNIPGGALVRRRGRALTDEVAAWVSDLPNATYVSAFDDAVLADPAHWSPDGLHMGPLGHLRVATNCLTALGVPVPADWDALRASLSPTVADFGSLAYWREHVLPWIGRRVQGRSSGDNRVAKRPLLAPVATES
ncbi:MAG: SGNH/GDSL hydrolase family protein [Microbacteriaceae bacterium]|nr:SGNH/GDSL hydrolase family protein [Microbacteriaceae bacterium]MCL2795159.1 SGNH/GDSL hydrolase family protein [Microbacteriaceae bacterium]